MPSRDPRSAYVTLLSSILLSQPSCEVGLPERVSVSPSNNSMAEWGSGVCQILVQPLWCTISSLNVIGLLVQTRHAYDELEGFRFGGCPVPGILGFFETQLPRCSCQPRGTSHLGTRGVIESVIVEESSSGWRALTYWNKFSEEWRSKGPVCTSTSNT